MVSTSALSNNATVSVLLDQPVVQASNKPTNFVISAKKADVANYAKEGNDLVIELVDGRTVRIKDFFANGGEFNHLIFSSGGTHWLVDMGHALGKSKDGVDEQAITYTPLEENDGISLLHILAGLAGIGAIGGIAAGAGGGGGGGNGLPPMDITPPPSPTFSVWDDVEPKAGELKTGDSTNDTMPTITGSGAEPGSKILIRIGSGDLIEVLVDGDGNWAYTPGEPLADGYYVIEIIAVDGSGNQSPPSYIGITIDTTPPEAPAYSIVDDNTEGGKMILPGETTSDNTPLLKGLAAPGSTITIIIDGGEPVQVVADADGVWSYSIPGLADGNHTVSVKETDKAGNESGWTDGNFIVDTTPPATPEVIVKDDNGNLIEPGQSTDDGTPTFSGKGEPGNTIIIEIDGEEHEVVVGEDGSWEYTPEDPLGEGEHQVIVKEKDKAGNESGSAEIGIEVDTKPPATPEVDVKEDDGSPVIEGVPTNDNTPTFSGKGEPGNTIIVEIDGELHEVPVGEDGSWQYTPENPLGEGEHGVIIREKDDAGNISDPKEIIVDVDTQAPVPTLEAKDDEGNPIEGDPTSDNTPTFSGVGEAGNKIIITIDGVAYETVVGEDGTWRYTPENPLGDGQYTVSVTETDAAGNVSDPVTKVIDIDAAAPAKPQFTVTDNEGEIAGPILEGSVTDDRTPTFSGKGEAGNTIVLTINGNVHRIVIDGNGDWTFTPETPLEEGQYTVSVTETDAAGNVSESSDISFMVDNTAPGAPTIDKVMDDQPSQVGEVNPGETTNDTTPTLSGSGADTSGKLYIYVSFNGGEPVRIGEAVVQGDGSWSFTANPPLSFGDGEYEFTARNADAAGNLGDPSDGWSINLDTSSPTTVPVIKEVYDDFGTEQGVIDPNGKTDDNSPVISGEGGTPGDRVFIYDTVGGNRVKIGEAIVDENGAWRFDCGEAGIELASTFHTFTVTYVDAAGNEGPSSDGYSIEINASDVSTVPTISQVVDNDGSTSKIIGDGQSTNDLNPMIKGGSGAGVITIYVDGVAVGTTTADEHGNWSFEFPEGYELLEGEHVITATSTTDFAGESAHSQQYTIIVDVTPPDLVPEIGKIMDNQQPGIGDVEPGGSTNDTRPVISGIKGEANGKVNIYVTKDGVTTLIGTANANGDGEWSLRIPEGHELTDGSYSITVKNVDAAGNESEASAPREFTVDTVRPSPPTIEAVTDNYGEQQGRIAPNGATDDPRPVLNGMAEANSLVSIYDNGTKIGEVRADSEGKWTFTPSSDLVGDNHNFTVKSTDAAGNESDPSTGYPIEYSPAPTEIPRISDIIDEVGLHTGPVQRGGVTDDPNLTIKGTNGGSFGKVAIYDGDVRIALVDADEFGNWTHQFSDLGEGSHSFTTRRVSEGGAEGPNSESWTVEVDLTGPGIVEITKVTDNTDPYQGTVDDGEVTNDRQPVISGTGVEPGGSVKIFANGEEIEGTVTVESDGTWTFHPLQPLGDGSYTFTAKGVDAAGNIGADLSGGYTVVIDTTAPLEAPKIEVILDEAGAKHGEIAPGGSTDDTRPTIKGSGGEPGGKVYIYVDGVFQGEADVDTDGSWTFKIDKTLSSGSRVITAKNVDEAGNVNETPSDPYEIIIDVTAPATPEMPTLWDNTDPKQGQITNGTSTNDNKPEIKGSGAEPNVIVTIYETVNGEKIRIGEVRADGEGNWVFRAENYTQPLGEGAREITVTYTDEAGNESHHSGSTQFTVDTVAPVPTLEASDDEGNPIVEGDPTNDNTPTFSGQGEPGNKIIITIDGVAYETVVGEDGTWRYTPENPLSDGQYTVSVTETDAAGNISDPVSKVIEVATIPPGAVEIKGVFDDVGSEGENIDDGGQTNDNTPLITGTGADANGKVRIYAEINGEKIEIGTVTADENGNWEIQLLPGAVLADGTYKFTAYKVSESGVEGTEPSNSWTIFLIRKPRPVSRRSLM